ncbi:MULTISPECIES: hypothetical protein [unclassified Actinopolyspora]|uniref:hypothetical protein n=1 Tax=unclassified Actinopolyspora TaxID=2639451 RepID=UPI0013F603F5|nr:MULTISPECIES: hypothetical protein [unclassified Actinopolyspora]NHD16396.1 hypothetical protein [Actinopolyspora sp. BKK2]NHE75741.1 hypothetical protein [Actinopolyspora sp. BKK1]
MGLRGSDDIHKMAKKVDASMATLNQALRKFGVPKGIGNSLTTLKTRTGNVISQLEMSQRRQ